MPGRFFDTNVLLDVASGDPAKADRTEELIGAGGIISVQVLNEIEDQALARAPAAGVHLR
jgi:predicted nucleic acid-binding protein